MSGTSLDGVDLAYCEFTRNADVWEYHIGAAETIPYDEKWLVRLTQLAKQPAFVFPKTDAYYGRYLGQLVNRFIQQHQLNPDYIASHGHTIFHQPQNGFTAQIGSGAGIYAETGITTINDFRVVDVALGGQGAPLVPIGDELLFSSFGACLNLGGFSNISFNNQHRRIAFDISPCNVLMNPVARQLGLPYDDEGKLAASGSINNDLLHALNQLEFYAKTGPKSLGTEWVNEHVWPLVQQFQLSHEDLLATFSQHIASQVAQVINQQQLSNILVTGGGSFNKHLIGQINTLTSESLTIPDDLLIQYKEALIFAFLGVLRLRKEHNSLKEITGAQYNSIGGCIWG